jgi:hypothetical protein
MDREEGPDNDDSAENISPAVIGFDQKHGERGLRGPQDLGENQKSE